MKKAKILVPAMGMLLLSTAASISGSLAWFTANRTVQVTTTSFAVDSTDGSLTVAAVAGTATAVNDAENKVVTFVSGNKLTDASYDINNDVLYTDISNDDGSQPTSYQACPSGWAVPGATQMYYGATFTLNFTYAFRGDTTSMDLFFDLNSTVVNSTDTAGTGSGHTYNGFRIAFVAQSGGEKFVWAPNRASTVENANKHLTDNSGIKETTYTEGEIAYSNTDKTLYNDGVAANATKVNHLGVLANSAGTGTLAVKCVVWYEGTDPDVINSSSMDNVAATLKFYVRKVSA